MTAQYQSDFYGWTQEQADLLKTGRVDELDISNLLEEIESMGRSERRELESRLEMLLAHLLKWKYQPGHRSRSWTLTITEQRQKVGRCLRQSPSLKGRLEESFSDAYADATLFAARETGMDESLFPTECPWAFQQVMTADFLPE